MSLYLMPNKSKKNKGNKSSKIPWGLFEYFQAHPAVVTAPTRLPTAPNLTASLAVLS